MKTSPHLPAPEKGPPARWQARLRRCFSCPNLVSGAKPDCPTPAFPARSKLADGAGTPKKVTPAGAGIQDTKAAVSAGRKVTIQSAGGWCLVSLRVSNLGLLWEATFRFGNCSFQITSDHLTQ